MSLIIYGYENIDRSVFFEFADGSTRFNMCKLKKREHLRTTIRANTFSARVVNTWNALPEYVSA